MEHDARTLLIHLSDEDELNRCTTIAVDHTTHQWAVAQGVRQIDTARNAYTSLYQQESLEE